MSRIDALVIDDWAMAPLTETEGRDFWEICEDRYQARSLILTPQLPVTRWHEQIGDPTVTASRCAATRCVRTGQAAECIGAPAK
jgi:DNA replication protein DnaC